MRLYFSHLWTVHIACFFSLRWTIPLVSHSNLIFSDFWLAEILIFRDWIFVFKPNWLTGILFCFHTILSKGKSAMPMRKEAMPRNTERGQALICPKARKAGRGASEAESKPIQAVWEARHQESCWAVLIFNRPPRRETTCTTRKLRKGGEHFQSKVWNHKQRDPQKLEKTLHQMDKASVLNMCWEMALCHVMAMAERAINTPTHPTKEESLLLMYAILASFLNSTGNRLKTVSSQQPFFLPCPWLSDKRALETFIY